MVPGKVHGMLVCYLALMFKLIMFANKWFESVAVLGSIHEYNSLHIFRKFRWITYGQVFNNKNESVAIV